MTSPQADPALDLLNRYQAGDPKALELLINDVLPWLHNEVRRSMGHHVDGAQSSTDLVQTVILNFLSWGPRFVPQSGAQFRALLKRIATNELIDQRRREGRSKERKHLGSVGSTSNPLSGFAGPSLSSQRPSMAAVRAEEQEWVRLALQFLSAEDRQLLLASEVEGIDWATIASDMGLQSPDAARVRAARLKPKVANLLRQLKSGMLPDSGT